MIVLDLEQGTHEWLQAKLGVISASNISKVLAKKGTETRQGYMSELVAQIASGEVADEIQAKALEWGKINEQSARLLYQFETGNLVDEVGFFMTDDHRCGCSPDGIIKGQSKGLELKCPYSSKVFVEFAALGKIKPEYVKQCQFSMWVTGFEAWDFANYDPRIKSKMLHYTTIERDDEMMKLFDEVVPEFISEMDEMLAKLGTSFSPQWAKAAGE